MRENVSRPMHEGQSLVSDTHYRRPLVQYPNKFNEATLITNQTFSYQDKKLTMKLRPIYRVSVKQIV